MMWYNYIDEIHPFHTIFNYYNRDNCSDWDKCNWTGRVGCKRGDDSGKSQTK